MSKHTPGPWSVANSTDVFIDEISGEQICDCDCSHQISLDESSANARLIAAAPEMLEFIKNCAHAHWPECEAAADEDEYEALCDCGCAAARALIARVEGDD